MKYFLTSMVFWFILAALNFSIWVLYNKKDNLYFALFAIAGIFVIIIIDELGEIHEELQTQTKISAIQASTATYTDAKRKNMIKKLKTGVK